MLKVNHDLQYTDEILCEDNIQQNNTHQNANVSLQYLYLDNRA